MKLHFTILLFLTLLLNSCAKKATSESLAETAAHTVTVMYETLPKECQTENTAKLRDTSIKQIMAVSSSCGDEKALLHAKISERNLIILILFGIIFLYFGAKFFSRFHL